MVDTSVRGALMNKGIEDAFSLLDDMVQKNEYQWSAERSPSEIGDVYHVKFFNKISYMIQDL